MIALSEFEALVDEVAKLNGLSADEAARVVGEIGDTPELNDAGEIVFEGRVVAWPAGE